jgi:hypothetical protein
MSIERITISVPQRLARRIKKAAASMSVSAWVTSVIEERLGDAELEQLWDEFYRSVGPSRADVRAANAAFKRLTGRARRRKVA